MTQFEFVVLHIKLEIWYIKPFRHNAEAWPTDGRTDGHRATAKTALRI